MIPEPENQLNLEWLVLGPHYFQLIRSQKWLTFPSMSTIFIKSRGCLVGLFFICSKFLFDLFSRKFQRIDEFSIKKKWINHFSSHQKNVYLLRAPKRKKNANRDDIYHSSCVRCLPNRKQIQLSSFLPLFPSSGSTVILPWFFGCDHASL